MRSRLWLVFVLLAANLFVCRPALANEYFDSFANGLSVWQERPEDTRKDTGTEIESDIDRPALKARPTTILDYIMGVVDAFNGVVVNNTKVSFIRAIRFVIYGRTRPETTTPDGWSVLPKVLMLVFMWWGVRKAVRMILTAFRKGKINA